MSFQYRSGPRLNIKTVFPRYGMPMLKIRRWLDYLVFNMGIPILVRLYLYIDTGPGFLDDTYRYTSVLLKLIDWLKLNPLLDFNGLNIFQ